MASLNYKQITKPSAMEYSVYIYHKPSNENNKPWERKVVTTSLKLAKMKAFSLYKSKKYEKVELQSLEFNPQEQSKNSKVMKVYYDESPLSGRLMQVGMLFFKLICGLALAAGFYTLF